MEGEATLMTFVELMGLAELRDRRATDDSDEDEPRRENRFMSLNEAFHPGGEAAYGGHVYAQAVWAASMTVDEEMVVHNVHGFFTLPGLADRPFIYTVTILSSGRSYSTRYVTARQPLVPSSKERPFHVEDSEKELSNVCYACMVSFKKDEKKSDRESKTGHQMKESVWERFGEILQDVKPETLERCPNVDTPWYWRHIAQHPQKQNFPGLEMRTLDMASHNATKYPTEKTNLIFYRPIGFLPPEKHNLHACAHLYASDRNSLFVVSKALGFGEEVGSMGSLSHSVVLHVSKHELALEVGKWWVSESWTPRSGQGRGVHQSRIWDGRGTHVASSWQEGMVRRAEGRGEQRQRRKWEEARKSMGLPFLSIEEEDGEARKHKL